MFNRKALMQATHKMGFTYNAKQAVKWEIEASDWIGCFVNCNSPQHKDIGLAEFEKLVQYDTVNEEAVPVLVYLREGVPVAWSDEENEYGYIVE